MFCLLRQPETHMVHRRLADILPTNPSHLMPTLATSHRRSIFRLPHVDGMRQPENGIGWVANVLAGWVNRLATSCRRSILNFRLPYVDGMRQPENGVGWFANVLAGWV